MVGDERWHWPIAAPAWERVAILYSRYPSGKVKGYVGTWEVLGVMGVMGVMGEMGGMGVI